MTAQSNTPNQNPITHVFKIAKENKTSTIFERQSLPPRHTFITSTVKIEDFQGYSRGKDFNLYFRIKDQSSWSKSEAITGLFPTGISSVYFGNRRKGNTRTLLVFKFEHARDELTVLEYPHDFYPNRAKIDDIVRNA